MRGWAIVPRDALAPLGYRPALPPLRVLTVITAAALTKHVPADGGAWLLLSMTAVLALHGVRAAANQGVFDNSGLLEEWEEAPFRRRFEAASAVGRLDWSPAVMLQSRSVKLYDPADGESAAARQRVITGLID